MTPAELRALAHIDRAAGILRSLGNTESAKDELRRAWGALDDETRDEALRTAPVQRDRRAA